jgi:hypothetical protein
LGSSQNQPHWACKRGEKWPIPARAFTRLRFRPAKAAARCLAGARSAKAGSLHSLAVFREENYQSDSKDGIKSRPLSGEAGKSTGCNCFKFPGQLVSEIVFFVRPPALLPS